MTQLVYWACTSLLVLTCATSVSTAGESDCQDGWSSCDSSLWVTSNYNAGDPLSPYAPGDTRGPLEYEVKFSCRGRRNGYYADLDHSCKVWHYCNTTREVDQFNRIYSWTYMHYSYVCPDPGTRYDQVLRECVPESKALVRCRDSGLYYPKEDYAYDVPVVVSSNNRLVPVRCPTIPSEVKCNIQNDHIRLKGCPESPGAVVKFYSSFPDVASSYFGTSDPVTTLAPKIPSSYASSDAADGDDDESGDSDSDDSVDSGPVASSTSRAPQQPVVSSTSPNPVDDVSGSDDDEGDDDNNRPGDTNASPVAVSSTVASVTVAPAPLPTTRRAPIVPRGPARIPVPTSSFVRQKPFRFRDTPEVAARKTIAQNADSSGGRKYLSPVQRAPSNREHSEEHKHNQVVFPSRASHTAAPELSNISDEVALPIVSAPAPTVPAHLDTSFDCNGRVYGYYADVKNDCRIYHVCAPKLTNGERIYEHYSFICADGLVFDQQRVTCVPREDASLECSNAESYYATRVYPQAQPSHQSVLSPVKSLAPAAVKSAANAPRTVTILTVRSTGKYGGAATKSTAVQEVARFPLQAERGRRGDQSPVNEDEVSPVHSPTRQVPAVNRALAVNRGTKALRVNQVTEGASVKKFQSPSSHRYAYLREPAVSPQRKVVYRLKKNLPAPIPFTGRSPLIERNHKVNSAKKSSQLLRSPNPVQEQHKAVHYSSHVSHVTHLNHHPAVQYTPPLVSPARAVTGHLARSASNLHGSYVPLSHVSPLVSSSQAYRGASASSPLGISSRLEDAESALYW